MKNPTLTALNILLVERMQAYQDLMRLTEGKENYLTKLCQEEIWILIKQEKALLKIEEKESG